MSGNFADNPYYIEYENLLKKVHFLIAQGKGDSAEADALRDEMGKPEQELSHEEIMRLNGLSADLYMLQDDEIFEAHDGTQEQLREDLSAAWERSDWETLLALLRKGPRFLPQDRLAYLRARAYAALGHLDTALLFARFAAEQNPQNAFYRLAVLDLLLKLHRNEDALAQADAYVQSAEEPLALSA